MATKVEKKNFTNYLAEAKSWESSKVRSLEQSKRLAWILASIAITLSVLCVFAVAMLSPLKTAVPYVIRVDNATGAVDVINALKDGKTTYDEAMNKYNLQWYVRWREGYSKSLISDYYKNVGVMSVQREQSIYSQQFAPKNPDSPLIIYGENGNVKVSIKSTSFIKENVASVRYLKEIKNSANGKDGVTHWVATIVFQYSGEPMSEENRSINPLGFQVIEYRNDPDQEISKDSPSNFVRPQNVTGSSVAPAVPSIQ